MNTPTQVWDFPTRLFHWLLVALVAFSWWSAENREMAWHFLSGLAVFGLIAFRLIWGVIGGSTARFASFVPTPGKLSAYLRGEGTERAGHNPLGALSVLALLALLAIQVGTGFFATDTDGLESGPLSFLVSFDQGRDAAEFHELAFNLLLGLIVLHVLAVLFYLVVKKRNLVRPMITGRAPAPGDVAGGLVPARPVRAVAAIAVAAGLAWAASKGFFL